jgi:excisionase family DNA binding protein
MTPAQPESPLPKLLLTPEEAACVLGIGRTKLYRLLATNQLRGVRIDGSRRISAGAVGEFVRRLDAEGQVATGRR